MNTQTVSDDSDDVDFIKGRLVVVNPDRRYLVIEISEFTDGKKMHSSFFQDYYISYDFSDKNLRNALDCKGQVVELKLAYGDVIALRLV